MLLGCAHGRRQFGDKTAYNHLAGHFDQDHAVISGNPYLELGVFAFFEYAFDMLELRFQKKGVVFNTERV